jgi:hypothetical protein
MLMPSGIDTDRVPPLPMKQLGRMPAACTEGRELSTLCRATASACKQEHVQVDIVVHAVVLQIQYPCLPCTT